MATTFMTISSFSSSFMTRGNVSIRSFPATSKLFGLGHARCGRITAMATYTVKFITPNGTEEVMCDDDQYLLDAAEERGIGLPYSCRDGSCSSCTGKIVGAGKVNQLDGCFLDDDLMGKGYVLTCVAYPMSDLVIETGKEYEIIG